MINPQYADMIDQLQEHFATNGQISLQEVLLQKNIDELKAHCAQLSTVDELMHTHHKQSQVHEALQNYLTKHNFLWFLNELTQEKLAIQEGSIHAYKHKDFLLRRPCKPGIVCLLEIGNSLPLEVGGSSCYAQGEETVTIPVIHNSLSLLHVDEQTEEFVTYVTHHAQGKRLFIRLLLTFSKA